jgi:metal-sulfur cluster biosynthetic enzyme
MHISPGLEPTTIPPRTKEIWSALDTVTDPELDESVTSLEFITSVQVGEESQVRIAFRLPTYWCAPNFAFLMASDMRDAVAEIPWVRAVEVKLLDHFSADLINRAVALRRDFRDAFPGETDDDLSEVRKKFLGKAYQRRQELLIRHLLGNGFEPVWFTRVSLQELIFLPLASEGVGLRNLYLFSWRRVRAGCPEESLAFTTVEGTSIDPADFRNYLRRVAGVRRNAEFNAFICRGLLEARNGRETLGNSAEPKIIDQVGAV